MCSFWNDRAGRSVARPGPIPLMQDPAFRDHQAWLGYLQPDGLVVSSAALVDCQVTLPRTTRAEQERILGCIAEARLDADPQPVIADLPGLLRGWLGWPDDLLYGLDVRDGASPGIEADHHSAPGSIA